MFGFNFTHLRAIIIVDFDSISTLIVYALLSTLIVYALSCTDRRHSKIKFTAVATNLY